MTEFSMETAARSRVPTCPAKIWVTAPREYWHMEVKTAGPARNHSFLDSRLNSRKKSRTLVMGGMSSESGLKVLPEMIEGFAVAGRGAGTTSSLDDRSGCLLSAIWIWLSC